MRKQILAGATALVLATGMTTSAVAFDHGGRSSHAGRSHSGFGGSRFAGVRGFSEWRQGGRSYGGTYYHGHPTDLGPLGFTFGSAAPYGYAPGTSIAAWSY
jgi:hypothetical protein